MSVLFSLLAVVLLGAMAYFGASAGQALLFGVVIPYAALAVFVAGLAYRVVKWARSPVPFRIPTTCGQQKSLSWMKADNLENPHNLMGLIGRMALEILFFRSLFRNTKAELKDGRLVYGGNKWLWLAALAFHWSFLVVLIRHARFFLEPVPSCLVFLQHMDSVMQIGVPALCISGAVLAAAVGYLLFRRLAEPQIRYISLPADYFPLFLILGIALTGILMRHFIKADLVGVKELAVGLATFHPVVPEGIGVLFYIHLFLVCSLVAYFPFSKLMHMAGVFLSPTRNLVNNNRRVRHINPWNPTDVKPHSYEEWEDEFRDKMRAAGLPLVKE